MLKRDESSNLRCQQHPTYLYAIMDKILVVLKLAGGVVFVCRQKLALEHVVDWHNGQVERETALFSRAQIRTPEIVHHIDGNNRCDIKGLVVMLQIMCFATHWLLLHGCMNLSLNSDDEQRDKPPKYSCP